MTTKQEHYEDVIDGIREKRQQEITEGKNLSTTYPLYIVYDIIKNHGAFVTCCFTYEAAEAFIRAERHNLKKPYIYVVSIPRRNQQMMQLVELFGDAKR